MSTASIRPTKKQRELLTFIEQFINEHGYSPSYREIMTGLNYTSVATVSLHVTSLIKRGHLRKRDRSARSLEVVSGQPHDDAVSAVSSRQSEEQWLVQKVEKLFAEAEAMAEAPLGMLEDLQALVTTLCVLGLEEIAAHFEPRLTALREQPDSSR